MIDITNEVSEPLNEIWKKYRKRVDYCELSPTCISEVEKNEITFVGLNPSVSEEDAVTLREEADKSIVFYSHSDAINHKYFSKFIDISSKTSMAWTHLDLLFMRGTKQKEIEALAKTQDGRDFILEQLAISLPLLYKTEPKIVVVCNTFARELLKNNKWLALPFNFDQKIGTYRHQEVPYFFSSMLTGQRALDIGSYERLVWHINYVLGKDELR